MEDVGGLAPKPLPEGHCPSDSLLRFALEDGLLLACAGEKGLHGAVLARWDGRGKPRCEAMTQQRPTPMPYPCLLSEMDGVTWAEVPLPQDETAVIALREAD